MSKIDTAKLSVVAFIVDNENMKNLPEENKLFAFLGYLDEEEKNFIDIVTKKSYPVIDQYFRFFQINVDGLRFSNVYLAYDGDTDKFSVNCKKLTSLNDCNFKDVKKVLGTQDDLLAEEKIKKLARILNRLANEKMVSHKKYYELQKPFKNLFEF